MKPDKKKQFGAEIINKEDSSSSEDDADAVLLTEELESEFLKVLSHLKKKDSNLYSENIEYFSSDNLKNDDTVPSKNQSISSKQEYKEWLRGHINKIEDPEAKTELEALRTFWTNPAINKDEQFLRDYILSKQFLDPDDSFCLEKELKNLSEEEKEEEKQTIFEEKYNCRFENPDKEFFEKFPQTMKKAFGKKKPSATVIATKENNREKEANMSETDRGDLSLTKYKNKKRKSGENLKGNGVESVSNQQKKKLRTDDQSIAAKKQKNINPRKSNMNTTEINRDSKNVNIGKAEHLKMLNKTESKRKEVFNLLKVKKPGKGEKPKWGNKQFGKLPHNTEKASAIVTTTEGNNREKEASILDSDKGNESMTKHQNKKRKSAENLKNGTETEPNQQKKKLRTDDQSIPEKKQKHINPRKSNMNTTEINSDSKNVNIGKAKHLKKLNKTESKRKSKYNNFKSKVIMDKIEQNDRNLKKVFNLLKVKKLGKGLKLKWGSKQKIKQPKNEIFNKAGVKTKNKEETKKVPKIVKKLKDGQRKPRHRALKKKLLSN